MIYTCLQAINAQEFRKRDNEKSSPDQTARHQSLFKIWLYFKSNLNDSKNPQD